ncbi:MAG TPA: hypothetical protein VFJ19_13580 [Nocardioidaceae bacterium]|nr:hypothetical protein [Nocardioidaceae bacterium]
MPIPPPPSSTEGHRDRDVRREIAMIVRALEGEGPLELDGLSILVGAKYWEEGRFDRALRLAISDRVVLRMPDDRYVAASRERP